jgi:small nuclear ribonucleoprotein (snRNP)-like protein
MIDAKITQTMFYDQYRDKKVALLEKGQEVRIHRLHRFDDYHFENVYLCKVINPSDQSKNYGVRDGELVKVYGDNLEFIETESH